MALFGVIAALTDLHFVAAAAAGDVRSSVVVLHHLLRYVPLFPRSVSVRLRRSVRR